MKMVKVMAAGLLVAAMATPAFAEDRLSLSGEMRVRGFHTDNDADQYTNTWADQRLRIAGKISVAEGVSVTFRTDITEKTWGDGGSAYGAGRLPQDGQQWDRAHLDLTKGDYHLRLGQQTTYVGNQVADTQDAGVTFDINGAVPVSLFAYLDNNGTTAAKGGFAFDAETGGFKPVLDADKVAVPYAAAATGDDAFVYGVSVKPMSNVQVFLAGLSDDDTEAYGAGVAGSFDLDAVKVAGEVDMFFGDVSDTVDAKGLQAMLDVSTALDAATVGLQGYYAAGYDKADEAQVTTLGNGFNGWDPIMDVGTGLSNEAIAFGNPFDFTGEGAGVVGARLYANTKAGAASLGASVAYLATEEDKVEDVDGIALAAGVVYPVMDNTSFQVQLQYLDFEDNAPGATDDDEEFQAATGLFVKF